MTRSVTIKPHSTISSNFLRKGKHREKYARHTPSANIEERKEEYLITLAVPGFKREDFDINVFENAICIQPKKIKLPVSFETEEKTRCEYNFSAWRRKFILPENVDASFAHAFYSNGELDVHIPKNAHPLRMKFAKIDVY